MRVYTFDEISKLYEEKQKLFPGNFDFSITGPSEYLPNTWEGTILNLLETSTIPYDIRTSITLITSMTEKGARLAAVDSTRRALAQLPDFKPDPSLLKALEAAEQYAHGQLSGKELKKAHDLASSDDLATTALKQYKTESVYYAVLAAQCVAGVNAIIAAYECGEFAGDSAAESVSQRDRDADAIPPSQRAREKEQKKQCDYLRGVAQDPSKGDHWIIGSPRKPSLLRALLSNVGFSKKT